MTPLEETTILVVEDSPFLRYAARAVLQRRGYVVLEAADGQEAMDIMAHTQPDLVLLDLVMPRLSGTEVLNAMRNHPELKTIPVLVISNLEETDAGAAVQSQVQGYFVKANMSLAAMADRVECLLHHRRVA